MNPFDLWHNINTIINNTVPVQPKKCIHFVKNTYINMLSLYEKCKKGYKVCFISTLYKVLIYKTYRNTM